jgi:hypothetical protein
MWWVHVLARTWWGGGWPLLYDHSCSSVVENLQVILQFPYASMDYIHDPDMVLPPGEDWDHRGMCVICLFYFGRYVDQKCVWMLTLYLGCFADVGP